MIQHYSSPLYCGDFLSITANGYLSKEIEYFHLLRKTMKIKHSFTSMIFVFNGIKYYFLIIKLKFMIRYSAIFLVIAIIAAVFGFTGISSGAAQLAQILFFIFLVLFVIALVGKMLNK